MVAPDKKAAVEYYPALYWFSLLQVPPKSDFPGTGPNGNGISPNVKSQQWIRSRQHGRLHRLPPDGRQGHARDPQALPRGIDRQ